VYGLLSTARISPLTPPATLDRQYPVSARPFMNSPSQRQRGGGDALHQREVIHLPVEKR
jgi:hypothetical protein